MEWISVKDRLPETSDEVLASEDKMSFVVAWYKDGDWHVSLDMVNCDGDGSVYLDGRVDHWQPLPSPPKD